MYPTGQPLITCTEREGIHHSTHGRRQGAPDFSAIMIFNYDVIIVTRFRSLTYS